MTQKLCIIVSAAMVILTVQSLEIVNRADWGAQPPKVREPMNESVPYVVIHHSQSPPACYSQKDCSLAMRSMQNYHQQTQKWADIGYNFAIGGDGKVYEGRGFNVVGAHASGYNVNGIGICLIGDWQAAVPPQNMLQAAKDLISLAVEKGHLSSSYTLLGHRQVTSTACPGSALFSEIQQWPHFRNISK